MTSERQETEQDAERDPLSKMDAAYWLLEGVEELNMDNYTEEEVRALNDAAGQAFIALREYRAALRATPRAGTDETREAVAFTASAGTCRRCGSRVRMGGPAPDSCTNCAAPAESHPPRAGEVSAKAQALVDQINRIHADPRYRSVFAVAAIHGTPYAGPTYEAELQALTAALRGGAKG